MNRKQVVAMILISLMSFTTKSCPNDVPAGSAGGDSAGNNQPAQKCVPQPIKIQPVAYEAPEVHEYFVMVSIEDDDCGDLNFKNKAHIRLDGAYRNKDGGTSLMIWDDGKHATDGYPATLPYHTRGIVEKSRPHNVGLIATMAVTVEMLNAGAAWFTCQIERDHRVVDGIGEVGLYRVPITNAGPYEIGCRAFR